MPLPQQQPTAQPPAAGPPPQQQPPQAGAPTYAVPPPGIWTSTPARRLLWAISQLDRVVNRDPPHVADQRAGHVRLQEALVWPVRDYDWRPWFARILQRHPELGAGADEAVAKEAFTSSGGLASGGLLGPASQETSHRRRRMEREPIERSWIEKAAPESALYVALWPAPEYAAALAVPGGEPAALLHATVLYSVAPLSPEQAKDAQKIIADWAATAPRVLPLSALGKFPAEGGTAGEPGRDVLFAQIDSKALHTGRLALIAALLDGGVPVEETQPDFRPHVTLAYLAPSDAMPVGKPTVTELPVGEFLVSVAGETRRAPLGGDLPRPEETVKSYDQADADVLAVPPAARPPGAVERSAPEALSPVRERLDARVAGATRQGRTDPRGADQGASAEQGRPDDPSRTVASAPLRGVPGDLGRGPDPAGARAPRGLQPTVPHQVAMSAPPRGEAPEGKGATDSTVPIRKEDDLPNDVLIAIEAVADQIAAQARAGTTSNIGDLRRRAVANILAQMRVNLPPEAIEAAIMADFGMVTGVTDTTRTMLRRVLRDVFRQAREYVPGQGMPSATQFDYARRLQQEWEGLSAHRAEMIAVTEYNRTASVATLQAYQASGITHKRWFTVGDERVCEDCDGNAAQGEVEIDEAFESGDMTPPAHPFCRCNVSSALTPVDSVEPTPLERAAPVLKYDDDQPRDEQGKWTDAGGAASLGKRPSLPDSAYRAADGEYRLPTDGSYERMRAEQKAWDRRATQAVAMGHVTPAEAQAAGWHPNGPLEAWRPLPPTLYHVTTAADAVQRDGLKVRGDVETGTAGVGGGVEDLVSFTTDRGYADAIHNSMLELRRVATGETTAKDVMAEARRWPGVEEGIRRNMNPDLIIRGVQVRQGQMGEPPDREHEWRPTADSYRWTGGDGKERFTTWERPMTEHERISDTGGMWKAMSVYRETKGGPPDPMVFGDSWMRLKDVPASQIRTLEFEPAHEGAHGQFMGAAEAEYRTVPGAVRLRGVVKSALAKYDPDQPRDDDGKWSGSVADRVERQPATRPRDFAESPRGATGLYSGWLAPSGHLWASQREHTEMLSRIRVPDRVREVVRTGMLRVNASAHGVVAEAGAPPTQAQMDAIEEMLLPGRRFIGSIHTQAGLRDYDSFTEWSRAAGAIQKYDPDQPRDDDGKWSGESVAETGARAQAATERHKRRIGAALGALPIGHQITSGKRTWTQTLVAGQRFWIDDKGRGHAPTEMGEQAGTALAPHIGEEALYGHDGLRMTKPPPGWDIDGARGLRTADGVRDGTLKRVRPAEMPDIAGKGLPYVMEHHTPRELSSVVIAPSGAAFGAGPRTFPDHAAIAGAMGIRDATEIGAHERKARAGLIDVSPALGQVRIYGEPTTKQRDALMDMVPKVRVQPAWFHFVDGGRPRQSGQDWDSLFEHLGSIQKAGDTEP